MVFHSHGIDKRTIRWGSHKGSNSPLFDFTNLPSWDANPSSVQLLTDFAGTGLLNTTGGPGTNPTTSAGDLIELGFFASSLGSDNAIGGSGGTLIHLLPHFLKVLGCLLTSKTYIGQDWGTSSGPPDQASRCVV